MVFRLMIYWLAWVQASIWVQIQKLSFKTLIPTQWLHPSASTVSSIIRMAPFWIAASRTTSTELCHLATSLFIHCRKPLLLMKLPHTRHSWNTDLQTIHRLLSPLCRVSNLCRSIRLVLTPPMISLTQLRRMVSPHTCSTSQIPPKSSRAANQGKDLTKYNFHILRRMNLL